MAILEVVFAGALLGVLGKVVLASSLDIPVGLTMACGIGGALSGWLLVGALTDADAPGFDWLRWIVASGAAGAVVVNACLVFRGDGSHKS
jgi:hypothetical protein